MEEVKKVHVKQKQSLKKVLLQILQNLQENTCAIVSFLWKLQAGTYNFIKKETLAQVFSCEFYKISKNNSFTEHLWAIASVRRNEWIH